MRYIIKLSGTWTLVDDSTKEFSDKKQFDAGSIPELKDKFESYLTDEAFKLGCKSVVGVIESIMKYDWTPIAQNRNYIGTFVNTEDVQIDLNA